MHQLFTASAVITPDANLSPGWVLVRDGMIEAVGGGASPHTDADPFDLGDHTLIPGFVDIHVHGGGGFSLLAADFTEAQDFARWATTCGVTSVIPAVCAATSEDAFPILQALVTLSGSNPGGADVVGLNLEGPFVSPERLGALPHSWAHTPDANLLDRLSEAAGGTLRLITMAPEIEGASAVMSAARSLKVTVALGHTDANFDEAIEAFAAGASHVTHALNAMRPFHQRDPGVVGAALETPGVTIEVVADGVHLHPATVSLLLRAFGSERVVLVTDAVTPAGLERGGFRIGQGEATLQEGRITLPDGTIAGSAATMDAVVRNVVRWNCASLNEAVRMASTVPAVVAGAGDRKGRIAPTYDADLVALTADLTVAATWIRGVQVYSLIGADPVD